MKPDTVYWTLVENSPDLLEWPNRFLSRAELGKLATLRFARRRVDWLLGRWAAKSLLNGVEDCARLDPREIEIGSAPGGAPRVRLPDGTSFRGSLSISHRDGWVFCALSLAPGLKLGADLETVEPRSEAFLDDYLCEGERAWVRGRPSELQDWAAALVWSAKEAMLKALEVGLGWDTRWVEVLQVDGLAEAGQTGWPTMQVSSAAKEEHPWAAWWQRRGEYVMTLAGFGGQGPYRLVEVKTAGGDASSR
jgi:4'-phosphopantetheinyl transferase